MSGQGNLLYPEDPGVTGNIIPLRRDPSGGLHLAMPGVVHDAVNSAYNALVGPGELVTGKTPLGAPAHSDIPQIASDITGTMIGVGSAVPVEAGAFRTFGGPAAKTHNPATAKLAQDMVDQGYSDADIWSATKAADPQGTGYVLGQDGIIKHEIPDTGAKLHLEPWNKNHMIDLNDYGISDEIPLGQIASLPAFKAYPELADDIKVKMLPADSRSLGALDSHDDGTFTMLLKPAKAENMLSTMLHETQHAIQTKEGFALGGATENFLSPDYYSRKKFADGEFFRTISDARDIGAIASSDEGRGLIDGMFKQKMGIPLNNSDVSNGLQRIYKEHPDVYEDMKQVAEHYGILQNMRTKAFDQYQNLGGEVEARNVQERFAQGDYESNPHATQGYPKGQQIIEQNAPLSRVATKEELPQMNGPENWVPHVLEPVEHNPFGTPVDHDPFAEAKP